MELIGDIVVAVVINTVIDVVKIPVWLWKKARGTKRL